MENNLIVNYYDHLKKIGPADSFLLSELFLTTVARTVFSKKSNVQLKVHDAFSFQDTKEISLRKAQNSKHNSVSSV